MTSYINAKGKEIIVCKGGWKISREKMDANAIKHHEFAAKRQADHLAMRMAKLNAAIASGDAEEIEYLRFMYGM
jgi:uridylate kinase